MEFEPISLESAHRYGGLECRKAPYTLLPLVRHFVQADSMALFSTPDATDALVEVGVAEWPGVTDIVHMSLADTRLDDAGRTLEIFLDMLDANLAANHTYLFADKYEDALSAPDRSLRDKLLELEEHLPEGASPGATKIVRTMLAALGHEM